MTRVTNVSQEVIFSEVKVIAFNSSIPRRYQIDGHLRRLNFARTGKGFLPKYCLNSNYNHTRSSPIHPTQDWPQYSTIA